MQCRLADLSPAEPDWVNLIERQDELVAQLKLRLLVPKLKTADRFYLGLDIIGRQEEPFRRGFRYFIDCQVRDAEWTQAETRRVIAELTKLVHTTTIRGFQPYSMPAASLTELLAAPVASKLTGLNLNPCVNSGDWENEVSASYLLVAESTSLSGIEQLNLQGSPGIPPDGVAALAKSKAFTSIRRLTIRI